MKKHRKEEIPSEGKQEKPGYEEAQLLVKSCLKNTFEMIDQEIAQIQDSSKLTANIASLGLLKRLRESLLSDGDRLVNMLDKAVEMLILDQIVLKGIEND